MAIGTAAEAEAAFAIAVATARNGGGLVIAVVAAASEVVDADREMLPSDLIRRGREDGGGQGGGCGCICSSWKNRAAEREVGEGFGDAEGTRKCSCEAFAFLLASEVENTEGFLVPEGGTGGEESEELLLWAERSFSFTSDSPELMKLRMLLLFLPVMLVSFLQVRFSLVRGTTSGESTNVEYGELPAEQTGIEGEVVAGCSGGGSFRAGWFGVRLAIVLGGRDSCFFCCCCCSFFFLLLLRRPLLLGGSLAGSGLFEEGGGGSYRCFLSSLGSARMAIEVAR